MTGPTPSSTPVSLIGLPYHCGVRGPVPGNQMALGPEVLLESGRASAAFRDAFAEVEMIWLDKADQATDAENGGDYRLIPTGDQMGRILVQNIHLAKAVRAARDEGRIPIVSAGTCSASLGVVGGLEEGIGMIWFDTHDDAKTPDTSSNGFFEGMPVTTIAGHCWPRYRRQIPGFHEIPEDRIITVGNFEAYSPNKRAGYENNALGTVIDPPVIEKVGYEQALADALDALASKTKRVYVHVDTDVLDPAVLRANRHSSDTGLTDTQVTTALRMISERLEILAVSFSSFDPHVDPRGPDVIIPMMVEAARCVERSRQTA